MAQRVFRAAALASRLGLMPCFPLPCCGTAPQSAMLSDANCISLKACLNAVSGPQPEQNGGAQSKMASERATEGPMQTVQRKYCSDVSCLLVYMMQDRCRY